MYGVGGAGGGGGYEVESGEVELLYEGDRVGAAGKDDVVGPVYAMGVGSVQETA